MTPSTPAPEVAAALAALGKKNVLLAVHDVSFPFSQGEDVGHGSPFSGAGGELIEAARAMGFTGLQLGPQGRTSPVNPSPYDGTLFSKNELSIALGPLVEGDDDSSGLLRADELAALVASVQDVGVRADHPRARSAQTRALDRAFERFEAERARRPALARALEDFRRAEASWLLPDALYDVLAGEHGGAHHREWPDEVERTLLAPPPGAEHHAAARRRELETREARSIERYAFTQLVFRIQHEALQHRLRSAGMSLWGDLQVGMAPADEWHIARLLLPGYRLGAPPSRTNPAGQPWGYPVLDPERFGPGPAEVSVRGFMAARARRIFDQYDGLRVDHPHGLVCPWVYADDDPNPLHAVQNGARLFESPDLPDHPRLARYARIRRDQITGDPSVPRYADDWVTHLEPAQVEEYAVLLQTLLEAAKSRGLDEGSLACEVLSTQPRPLRQVRERLGLGQFRVTQKADPRDPDDVYRSENAQPEDWIMVGTHDTPSIWACARAWAGTDHLRAEAAHLARRLRPDGSDGDPAALEAEIAQSPSAFVHAKLSDVFASRAENVSVFFPELFGITERYNEPGTVGWHNWTLRVPPDWRERVALDLPRVLADALRARGGDEARAHAELIRKLERSP